MLKLLHVPEEIVRTVEKKEGLQRNDQSDCFIINIAPQKASKIDFNTDSEFHLLEPVKKAAKLTERPTRTARTTLGTSHNLEFH